MENYSHFLVDILAYICKCTTMSKKKCCPNLELENHTSLFKALSDPNRINLLCKICELGLCGTKESNLKELCRCCDIDQSVVSRHLKILEKASVLNSNKRGKEVFYSLNGGQLSTVLRKLADFIDNCSC